MLCCVFDTKRVHHKCDPGDMSFCSSGSSYNVCRSALIPRAGSSPAVPRPWAKNSQPTQPGPSFTTESIVDPAEYARCSLSLLEPISGLDRRERRRRRDVSVLDSERMQAWANGLRMLRRRLICGKLVRGFVVALPYRRQTHVNRRRREFITLLGGAAARPARAARRQGPSHLISHAARVRRLLIGGRDCVSSFVSCDHEDIDRGTLRWRHPHRRLILVMGRRRSAYAAAQAR